MIVGRLTGNVVDPFTRSTPTRITYNSETVVTNGREIRPSHVVNQPRVEIGGNDLKTFYTLVNPLLACVN